MEDKDSEVFDTFFYNLSKKISNSFFSKKFNKIKIGENKFKYQINTNTEILNKILTKNIPKMSIILSKNIGISDKKSIQKILKKHYDSKEFNEKIDDITKPFFTNGELTKQKFLIEYGQFLKYALTSDSLKDKIFDLKTHDTFKDWMISKKETVVCGFALVILMLAFTFYVFIE